MAKNKKLNQTQDLLGKLTPKGAKQTDKGKRIVQTTEGSKGGRPPAMPGELERLNVKIKAETAEALRMAVAQRKGGKTQSEIVDTAIRAFLGLS